MKKKILIAVILLAIIQSVSAQIKEYDVCTTLNKVIESGYNQFKNITINDTSEVSTIKVKGSKSSEYNLVNWKCLLNTGTTDLKDLFNSYVHQINLCTIGKYSLKADSSSIADKEKIKDYMYVSWKPNVEKVPKIEDFLISLEYNISESKINLSVLIPYLFGGDSGDY